MANALSVHTQVGAPASRHQCHAQRLQQLIAAQGLGLDAATVAAHPDAIAPRLDAPTAGPRPEA